MEPEIRTALAWMTLWHPTSPNRQAPGRVARALLPVLRGWTALMDSRVLTSWTTTEHQVHEFIPMLQALGHGQAHPHDFEPPDFMQPQPIAD